MARPASTPCKPSQIGANYPPSPSSSPSYRFGNVLSALALAVSRTLSVDTLATPLLKNCKHVPKSSAVHASSFLVVHFGMANKTARISQQEVARKHGQYMNGGIWSPSSRREHGTMFPADQESSPTSRRRRIVRAELARAFSGRREPSHEFR
ncbi:hypothetical protein DFH09DRAFT_175972 [Mycena vulgaris]|nr:hypothetical protein DFH09DRAFT_175972 [Mycena vulgaris]